MTAQQRPGPGLRPTSELLAEAGLEAEWFQACEQGPQNPSEYYDDLAAEPQEPDRQISVGRQKPARRKTMHAATRRRAR